MRIGRRRRGAQSLCYKAIADEFCRSPVSPHSPYDRALSSRKWKSSCAVDDDDDARDAGATRDRARARDVIARVDAGVDAIDVIARRDATMNV